MGEYKRICSQCGVDIYYTTASSMRQSEKLNRKCKKCGCGWARGYTKYTNESLLKMSKSVSVSNKGCTPWNRGLTKETHPSLEVIGQKRKGKTHSADALDKISKASTSHWKRVQYRELVIERVKETYTDERIELWRKKMENGGHFTPIDEKGDVERYRHLVWYYTRKNDLSILENYENRGRLDENENAYHLDHIYSITDGYINKVDPEIIGSIHNLRFIPAIQNQMKKTKSDISLKKLKKLYYGQS